MSHVDNYVLKAQGPSTTLQKELIDPLNQALREVTERTCTHFVPVGQHAGGPKVLETDLFLAATNYFSPPQMVPVVRKIVRATERHAFPYGRDKHDVQLFVQTQHDIEQKGLHELDIWDEVKYPEQT